MTPSPDPQPDRKQLGADELIAVFVALTSIGAIFFWSLSQNRGLDAPFLQAPAVFSSATPLPTPLVTPSTPAIVAPPIDPLASRVPVPSPSTPPPAPVAPQVAPFVVAVPPSQAPTAQPKQFTDVPTNFWASGPIAALSARGILDGFPDGSFKPNKPVTRAEFAEMVRRAFQQPASREALKFNDLEPGYWATSAIDKATKTRFMSGFPDGSFQPNRQIPRLQVLIALVTGLNLQAKSPPNQVLSRYQDAEQIPKYALDKIAAATEAGLVLNDTNPNVLAPNQVTTRAEAAALVYEALRK